MVRRLFGLYVLIELAVVVALTYAIGFGWTVLLLLGTFALGLLLAGSQATKQLARLRAGLSAPQGPAGMRAMTSSASDGALIALGTVLTVIPGLVTSVLGVLLLLPPTRVIARPAVIALGARTLGRVPVVVTQTGFAARTTDYIDGEVIDVTDVHAAPQTPPQPPRTPPPNLPARPE